MALSDVVPILTRETQMSDIQNVCRTKTNQVAQENLPFLGPRLEWFLLSVATERPLYDVAKQHPW